MGSTKHMQAMEESKISTKGEVHYSREEEEDRKQHPHLVCNQINRIFIHSTKVQLMRPKKVIHQVPIVMHCCL